MALVSYWPAPGFLVPFPGPSDAPLASSGAQATPTDYLTNLVTQGKLLTANPAGSAPAPIDYFQYAVYCTSLTSLVGVFGGQVVSTISYDGTAPRNAAGGGDFKWSPTSTATVDNGLVFGNGASGRWLRSYSGPVYSSWFGAYRDNAHDDSDALDAFYAAIPQGCEGILDGGSYYMSRAWEMVTPQTTVRGNPNLLATFGGADLYWHGASSSTYAVRMLSFGQTLQGVVVAASAPLLGGILVGNTSLHTLQTHNTVRDCTVQGGSAVGNAIIGFGFAVGADPTQTGNGQDFNNFLNCGAINMEFAGFYIGQSGNTIQTLLDARCSVQNFKGWVGQQKYVSSGQSDGQAHPYGVGVWMDRCNCVIIHNISFSSCETNLKVTGGPPIYVDVRDVDSENCKKMFVSAAPYLLSTVGIEYARCPSTSFALSSLGPDGSGASYTGQAGGTAGAGYAASDHFIIDNSGCSLFLKGLGITVGDNNLTRIDNCVRTGTNGSIVAISNLFPSFTPFDQSSDQPIVSWANFGSNGVAGTPQRVLDGAYRINSGGHAVVPVHFDAIQKYASFDVGIIGITSASAPPLQTAHNNLFGGHWNGSAIVPVTISDAATTFAVAFPVTETSSTYQVTVSPISFTGAPTTASTVGFALSKTTSGFTLTLLAAPGVGNSVTFRWDIHSGSNI